MTGNLHEIHIPPDADEPTDWAVRREFGLRYDAYREVQVREAGLAEAKAKALPDWFMQWYACRDPEAAWILEQQRQHFVRADLLEARCAK